MHSLVDSDEIVQSLFSHEQSHVYIQSVIIKVHLNTVVLPIRRVMDVLLSNTARYIYFVSVKEWLQYCEF